MITNSEIGIRGRLGNVLFQYAAMKGLAALNGSFVILPSNINERNHHGQQCLLKYFKIDALYVPPDMIPKICTHKFFDGENPRIFKPDFLTLPQNTNLIGHYENIKYFEHIESDIKREFQLVDEIKEIGKIKLQEFLRGNIITKDDNINPTRGNIITKDDNINPTRGYPSGTEIIAIHVRLGDGIDTYGVEYQQPWMDQYLKNAISSFDDIQNKIFICFTGGTRYNGDISEKSEIKYCEEYLGKYIKNDLFFSCGNSSIVDFSMLTQANHVIVLVFRTFIWWAGFTNQMGGKIIVPKNAKFAVGTDYWYRSFIQL